MDPKPVRTWMTDSQIADYFQVTRSTLYLWRKLGMPSYRIGFKTVRYHLPQVIQWIQDTQPDQELEK